MKATLTHRTGHAESVIHVVSAQIRRGRAGGPILQLTLHDGAMVPYSLAALASVGIGRDVGERLDVVVHPTTPPWTRETHSFRDVEELSVFRRGDGGWVRVDVPQATRVYPLDAVDDVLLMECSAKGIEGF